LPAIIENLRVNSLTVQRFGNGAVVKTEEKIMRGRSFENERNDVSQGSLRGVW